VVTDAFSRVLAILQPLISNVTIITTNDANHMYEIRQVHNTEVGHHGIILTMESLKKKGLE